MKLIRTPGIKSVGGREDIPQTPPVWGNETIPQTTVYETLNGSVSILNSKSGPIMNVTVHRDSIDPLPSWATLTWSGNNYGASVQITGTPPNLNQIGVKKVTLTATNRYGQTSKEFDIGVDLGPLPVWNTTSLPDITVYDPYSVNMNLTVPTLQHPGPLTSITVKTGSIPSWATMSWSGTTVNIAGTPPTLASLGTSNFTLTATNRYGSTDQAFTITVIDGALPLWNNTTLPSIVVTNAYSATLNLTVPTGVDAGPLTNVTISSGSLPNWASMTYSSSNSTVTINGTPPNLASVGTTNFTLTATNRYGSTPQAFSITVNNSTNPLWIGRSLPSLTVFDSYSQSLEISSAASLTSVVVKSGTSLPSWATLSRNGNVITIAGTPNNLSMVTTTNFTLTATNSSGSTDQAFSLVVNNGTLPSWSNTSLPDVTVFASYNAVLNISVPGSPHPGPLTGVTVTTGSLPSWASMSVDTANSRVTITGTPNNLSYLGKTSFTLTAANKFGSTAYNFSITVNNGPTVSYQFSSFPTAYYKVAYNTGTYTITNATSISCSGLQSGLSFNYTNGNNYFTITGTITSQSASSSTITISAHNQYYPTDVSNNYTLSFSYPSGSQMYGSGTTTFTVPTGVGEIRALAVGGGGRGADSAGMSGVQSSWYVGGAGGGSGRESQSVIAVTPGQQISITVGNGGQSSSVGSYLTASAGNDAGGYYGLTGGSGGFGGGAGARNRYNFQSNGNPIYGGAGGQWDSPRSDSGHGSYHDGESQNGGSGGGFQQIQRNGWATEGNGSSPACKFMNLSIQGWGGAGDGSGSMAGGGGGGINLNGWGPGGSRGGGDGGGGGGGYGGGGGGGGADEGNYNRVNAGGAGARGCIYIEWGNNS